MKIERHIMPESVIISVVVHTNAQEGTKQMLGNIKKLLVSEEYDLQERLFIILTLITSVSILVNTVEVLFTSPYITDALLLLGGNAVFILIAILSVRMKKVKTGALIISAMASFLFMPLTFIFGGGIYGDAPIWFIFCILFASMILNGRTKLVFLIADAVIAAICYFISYAYPDMIVPNTPTMAHLYSFVALILLGTAISIMVGFEIDLYKRESRHSEEQKKEIESLSTSQNRFFSSMSHEIRTPINTIIGLNEMIMRENVSDEVAENAANIQSASRMLLHLINDILDMSKFQSGQMKLSPGVYHTGDMLSELVGMMWIKAKEKGLEFHVNIAPDLPADLIGDEVRLKQILINLLNNAIKYTKEGSVTLTIQCGASEENNLTVVYSVADTGIGIKKESIPYLFNAFKRVDEDKNKYIEGTGLGLSIVKSLVDLMGGKITVNSVYTQGSTFIIEIPQKTVDDRKIGDINIEKRTEQRSKRIYTSKFEAPAARLLVVDDNASNLLVVKKLLRDTKIQIDTASNGEEALRKTLNNEYNVIFMDHLMPEMDGLECHRRIRTQIGGMCRNSKIAVLTANAGSENKTLYEKEGFDGYIVKPVSGEELERELYRLLPGELVYVTGSGEEILEETISWMEGRKAKKNVAITSESIADLPQEVIDEYGIGILAHKVTTEEGVFRDGIEIETNGLLEYMENKKRTVVSTPPDIGEHEKFFADSLSGANNIVHITIGKTLEHSSAPIAAEAAGAFDNVFVFDTGHLSSGEGLMAIEAARLAEKGMTPSEIISTLETVKKKVHTSFIVDNLDFLARSKQVSQRIADLTRSLMLRPVLVMKKGKMNVGRLYFGSKKRAWKGYINSVLRHPSDYDDRILFVTYVGLTKRDMDWIRDQIEKKATFGKIYFQKASPTIAVNCGVGTFGLLLRDAD